MRKSKCCNATYQISVSTRKGRRPFCNDCGKQCETTMPKENIKLTLSCFSIDCPERTGGKCNADEVNNIEEILDEAFLYYLGNRKDTIGFETFKKFALPRLKQYGKAERQKEINAIADTLRFIVRDTVSSKTKIEDLHEYILRLEGKGEEIGGSNPQK